MPPYLDGSLAGDFGYDPLGFAEDPADLKWMVHAELLNGRTAMVATVGIIVPALLTKAGIGSYPQWYEAGYIYEKNGGVPFGSLVAVEAVLVGFVEVKRWAWLVNEESATAPSSFMGMEGVFKGTTGEIGPYPGGIFDPLGFSKQSDAKFAEMKQKEVKNARLAMLAFLGYVCQYFATGKGPIDNLVDHLIDPTRNNFATNSVALPDSLSTYLLPPGVNPA